MILIICPFCPGNLILSRFAEQPMRNVAELARAVRQGGWEVVKAFWRAFDDLPYFGKMKTWWNWFFFGFFQTEVEVLDEVQIQATNIRSITYFAYAATMFRSWSWEVVGCQVSRCEEEQLVHEDSDPRPGWEHFWLWSPPFTKIQKMWPKEVMLQESMIPQIEKKYRHNANHWTIIYIYIHTQIASQYCDWCHMWSIHSQASKVLILSN